MPATPIRIVICETKPPRRRAVTEPLLPYLPARIAQRVNERDARASPSYRRGRTGNPHASASDADDDSEGGDNDHDDAVMFPCEVDLVGGLDFDSISDPEASWSSASSDPQPSPDASLVLAGPSASATSYFSGPRGTDASRSANRRASVGTVPSLYGGSLRSSAAPSLKSQPRCASALRST